MFGAIVLAEFVPLAEEPLINPPTLAGGFMTAVIKRRIIITTCLLVGVLAALTPVA